MCKCVGTLAYLCLDITVQDLFAVAVRQCQQQLHQPLPRLVFLYSLASLPVVPQGSVPQAGDTLNSTVL